ncbi:DUF952 domain-containing protein [Agreia sp. COWG]|uniref:DUF952 domain-containing protein n=1 Tax=Agreia sp. COWG TaxID=2773266 RepID=UPI001925A49F|nr:DUF952 domain-containing protein [Agreia sp. COWG]CAD5996164.1 conserved protein of unknown function [Agreia sp. COWG]
MGQRILHVAIADDWEASRNFGEYEVSTRGVGLFDDGYIRATTASGLAEVLRRRYSDLQLPLLLLVIDADALGRAGVNIVWSDPQPGAPASPRIEGILPMDDEVIVAALPIERINGGLEAPDVTAFDVVA